MNALRGIEALELRTLLAGNGFDFPGEMLLVGGKPQSVMSTDVDGDGAVDMIAVNYRDSTVPGTLSVLRNLGDGTFAPRVDYAIGYFPSSLTAADLDGDGGVDLIVTTGGELSVLRNIGNGTFAERVDYNFPFTDEPVAVAAADIDDDGAIDLITANSNSATLSVLRNLGDGTFELPTNYAVPGRPVSVAAVDINGDGAADLISASNDSFYVLTNLGDGEFTQWDNYAAGANVKSMTAEDIDGDGAVDLIAVAVVDDWLSGGRLAVLRNLGDGTFASRVEYAVGKDPFAITANDANGDGAVDLFTANWGSGTISALWNLGDGTFSTAEEIAVGTRPRSVAMADLNDDGTVDLIVANYESDSLSVLSNLGNSRFEARADYAVGFFPWSATTADVDGDGTVDLISANRSSLSVVRNLGDGTFAASHDLYGVIGGNNPSSIVATDVNRDGMVDLVAVGRSYPWLVVLRNIGDGAFAPPEEYYLGDGSPFESGPEFVVAADVDGDGAVDLVAASEFASSVFVLRNLGDGNFEAPIEYYAGSIPSSIVLVDVNDDDLIDLVVSNFSANTVSVLRNLGDGTFQQGVFASYRVGVGPRSVTVADVDSDEAVDLIVANSGSNSVSILRNAGDGTFNANAVHIVANQPHTVTAADLDDDGAVDLIVASMERNTVAVRRNLGNFGFAAPIDYATGGAPTFVTTADIDKDGDIDLIVANNESNSLSVLRNLRGTVVPPLPDLVVEALSAQPDVVALGGTFRVEYAVSNRGPIPANGRWVDSIFLSRDDRFDAADRLLTRVVHDGVVPPQGKYTEAVEVSMLNSSGLVPGEGFAIVRIDAGNDIPEVDNANNAAAVPLTIDLPIETLTLEQSFAGAIASGQARYFKVDLPAGQPVALTLDGLPADGAVEMYIRRDGLPDKTEFDRAAARPFATSQYALFPAQVRDTTFYILVYAPTLATSPAAFALTASMPTLAVRTTSFGTGGNVGDYTIRAAGIGFDRTVTARLIGAGEFGRTATSHWYESETELYATFDLRGVAPGTYDVVFTNDQGAEVTMPQSLTVIVAAPREIVPTVIAPSAVRRGREFNFTVEWRNDSLNDALAPLLTVGNTVPFGLSASDRDSLGTQYRFLGINTQGGPAGLLRPGQRESMTFWSYSDTDAGAYTVFADRVIKDLSEPFDWEGAVSDIRPAAMSEQASDAVSALLQVKYGSNAGGYLRLLSSAADATWNDPRNQRMLLQEEVQRQWSRQGQGIWGAVESDESPPQGGFIVALTDLASSARFVTQTDRFSQFHFVGLPNGSYRLSVDNQAITSPETIQTLTDGRSVGPLTVRTVPVQAISMQIDLLNGQAISDATIVLFEGSEVTATAITDAAGRVTLQGVPSGNYSLLVGLPGGGIRRQNITVSQNAPQEIEVNLAAGIVRGTLPTGSMLYPVMVSTGGQTEVIHPALLQNVFKFYAAAGEYALVLYDNMGNRLAEVETVLLNAGGEIDVGEVGDNLPAAAKNRDGDDGVLWFDDPEVGLGIYLVDGPPSAAAMSEITEYFQRDPDVVRTQMGDWLIAGIAAANGWEYAGVVSDYLYGGGYRRFTEGTQVVDGGGGLFSRVGFKKHPTTKDWLSSLLNNVVKRRVEDRITSGLLTLECDESAVYDIREIIPTADEDIGAQLHLYQDGNFFAALDPQGPNFDAINRLQLNFKNTLAGGVGWYGTPPDHWLTPDSRGLDAKVRITRDRDGHYTAKLENVRPNVHDAFDLWPGSLSVGSGSIQTYVTTYLAFLEINGRAGDVVFDVEWTDTEEREVTLDVSDASCDICDGPNPPDSCKKIERPVSFDPNDIIGPAGVGPENHLVATSVMPYMIRFENDPEEATAPAAMVTVTQFLDPHLDWATFRLGDIGFGDIIVDVPDDVAFVQTQVDLLATHGVFVDVIAGINAATGEIRWEFAAIDPATGDLPESPFVGFLPPNALSPEGEGFVTYTVRPKQSSLTGDRIDASASIVFDVNDPIATPPIFNTLDAGAPTSRVHTLPPVIGSEDFIVTWSGEDDFGGSGIASYDVFVSTNGGPWAKWQDRTTNTNATFHGAFYNTYSFYSVARDYVGHLELSPSTPDTTTEIRDITPPHVTGVLVRGSTWSNEFLAELGRLGVGTGGYAIPVGGCDQLATIPWTNIDQIVVDFDEDVVISYDDLSLAGLNISVYAFGPGGFSYDPAARRAIWTLAEPIRADKLFITLSDQVTDTAPDANRLDGDWTNVLDTFPSGNGVAGNAFRISMNMLPADVDRDDAVSPVDRATVISRSFSEIGHAGYFARHDLDGNGRIDVVDVALANNHIGTTLPVGNPGGSSVNEGSVVNVLVGGSTWAVVVRQLVDPVYGIGYSIPVGSCRQFDPLPWSNLNQISIVFSEAMVVDAAALRLSGVANPQYSLKPNGFSYDTTRHIATWTFNEPIPADKVSIHLADTVRTTSGSALDGEWLDLSRIYSSGDGTPGGDFAFRFNVLPGDVNQDLVVDVADIRMAASRFWTRPGDERFEPISDIDGNGTAMLADLISHRNLQGSSLPIGEPSGDSPAARPAAAPSALFASVRRTATVRAIDQVISEAGRDAVQTRVFRAAIHRRAASVTTSASFGEASDRELSRVTADSKLRAIRHRHHG